MAKKKRCPECKKSVTFKLLDDGTLRLDGHNRPGELNPIRVCPGSGKTVRQD